MNIKNLRANADLLFPDSAENYKIKKTYFAVLEYLVKNDWTGACHASSSILYVLLREQGFSVNLFIGEVRRENIVFDHSWLELNEQVMDAAIVNTLIKGISFSPVLNGFELENRKPTETNYSYFSGSGLEPQMLFYYSNPLGVYMSGFPRHPQGLWGIAAEIAKSINLRVNVGKLKQKYENVAWQKKS